MLSDSVNITRSPEARSAGKRCTFTFVLRTVRRTGVKRRHDTLRAVFEFRSAGERCWFRGTGPLGPVRLDSGQHVRVYRYIYTFLVQDRRTRVRVYVKVWRWVQWFGEPVVVGKCLCVVKRRRHSDAGSRNYNPASNGSPSPGRNINIPCTILGSYNIRIYLCINDIYLEIYKYSYFPSNIIFKLNK